jgi:4-carboxymuconolactone decarboxylase
MKRALDDLATEAASGAPVLWARRSPISRGSPYAGDTALPRIPPITRREQVAEKDRPAFDAIIASRGRINVPQSMNMYVPQLAHHATAMNDVLRASELGVHDFEVSVLTAAREMDCAFVWGAHVASGKKANVRREVIDAIGHKAPLDDLSKAEAIIVRYGRELMGNHAVSQATFDEALAQLGPKKLMLMTQTMGYYMMLSMTLISTEMETVEGMEPLPRL